MGSDGPETRSGHFRAAEAVDPVVEEPSQVNVEPESEVRGGGLLRYAEVVLIKEAKGEVIEYSDGSRKIEGEVEAAPTGNFPGKRRDQTNITRGHAGGLTLNTGAT